MGRHKVVILGPEDASIEAERAELVDLDVEFVLADPQSEGEAMEVVKDADAIMTRAGWGTAPVLNAAERCQVLAMYSHGFDNIDVEACTDNGIILTNSAGMCAEEVSDQAVAFILALNRHVVQATEHVRSGEWDRLVFDTDPLDSQVLGLVGFGNIARLVARKMTGWGMETVVFDPYASPWVIKEYRAEQVFDLNELCAVADYLTVIVPLNDETRHMIGAEQFNAMKKSAYLVNVCRGPVVDEKALIEALNDGQIRGAGLDVFEQEPTPLANPLLKMPNVICAPHMAGISTRSLVLSVQRAAAQVASVLRGEWPMAVQNPEVASRIEARRRSIGLPPAG